MADAPTFNADMIRAILQRAWKDPTTRINKDATKLTAEYLRLFVAEAIARAAQVAAADGSSTVEIEHLERILPQLLLDF